MTESRRKRTKSPDFISRNKKRFHGAKIFGKKKNDAGQTSIRNPKKMLFAGGRAPQVFHDNRDHGEIFPALIKYRFM